MSTKELKYLLISKIDDTEDEQLLKAIYTLLNSSSSQGVFTVNEAQADSIYKGKKDIEQGNYILNEDLHNEVMKWINK
jgi:predicted transcriptional regulator